MTDFAEAAKKSRDRYIKALDDHAQAAMVLEDIRSTEYKSDDIFRAAQVYRSTEKELKAAVEEQVKLTIELKRYEAGKQKQETNRSDEKGQDTNQTQQDTLQTEEK